MTSLIIQGLKIYTEESVLEEATLVVDQGKIADILEADAALPFHYLDVTARRLQFPPTYSLIPGRIDLHIHGIAGVDVMDAQPLTLPTMARTLPQEGTTSFLATTISMPLDYIELAIENVAHYMINENQIGARVLGLHLEGPFIAASKMGAHEQDYLLTPDPGLLLHWQALAKGAIKLVTFAPELDGADDLMTSLFALNIVASIGHSNASYAQATQAIQRGCQHVTHLFNAMSGLNHRSPGVALAALEHSVLCELIADGHHVAWDMLKFVMRIKGQHELCVVTDGMRAKCMPEGRYSLGHQEVRVEDGAARLNDGTLAGSVLTMEKAVQNLLTHQICDLSESIYLCSINPAKQLHLFHEIGSIARGKYADLVVLDEKYRVVMTICRGEISYQA